LPDKAVATIWINVHLQSQESKFAKIHGKWLMQNSSICVHTTSIIIFHKKKSPKYIPSTTYFMIWCPHHRTRRTKSLIPHRLALLHINNKPTRTYLGPHTFLLSI
jgi:hypothetical protein